MYPSNSTISWDLTTTLLKSIFCGIIPNFYL